MTQHTTKSDASPATQTILACRLRHRETRWGPSPTAGEVELENTSGEVLEIEGDLGPLQYLNLLVTDSAGNLLSAWHYANIFSPIARGYTVRLAPGEKYTHTVSLLGNVPEARRLPGCYTVRAVYQYRDLKAVSDPVEVQL